MSAPKIGPGSIFLLPGTGPAHDRARPHMCVVVADDARNGDYLVIPICSAHSQCDRTCVFDSSHTVHVEHESHASYFEAKACPKKGFSERFEYVGELPQPLLKQVLKGIEASLETEPRFRERYQAVVDPSKPKKVWKANDV